MNRDHYPLIDDDYKWLTEGVTTWTSPTSLSMIEQFIAHKQKLRELPKEDQKLLLGYAEIIHSKRVSTEQIRRLIDGGIITEDERTDFINAVRLPKGKEILLPRVLDKLSESTTQWISEGKEILSAVEKELVFLSPQRLEAERAAHRGWFSTTYKPEHQNVVLEYESLELCKNKLIDLGIVRFGDDYKMEFDRYCIAVDQAANKRKNNTLSPEEFAKLDKKLADWKKMLKRKANAGRDMDSPGN